MSRPDQFIGIDFAPPGPAGPPLVRIAAVAVAMLLISGLVVGVTQLLLH